MKRMEASKAILCVLYFLMFLIIGFTMYMTYKTSNSVILTPIIIGVFILCSSATGFYYWKAKAENMEKIRNARIKSGNKKVDMQDISNIQDNTAAAMSTAFGGMGMDFANTGANVYTDDDEEMEEYEE